MKVNLSRKKKVRIKSVGETFLQENGFMSSGVM